MKSLVLLISLSANISIAETSKQPNETMTIVGTRDRLQGSLGLSTHVIDLEVIDKKNGISLIDYLRDVPGLYVQRSGGKGGQASIFIRGANQDELIITVNGTPIADPSLVSGGFDLSHLSIADVEAIEIYKGAQSVLYGSDGLGGIINIVTKKGSVGNKVYAEAGERRYLRGGVQAAGQLGSWSYRINGEKWKIANESDADSRLGNRERDAYSLENLSFDLSYQGSDWASRLSGQQNHSEKDLDAFNDVGIFSDDLNYIAKTDLRHNSFLISKNFLDLEWAINVSQTKVKRDYEDAVDLTHSSDKSSQFESTLNQSSLAISGDLTPFQMFTIGFQNKTEGAESRSSGSGFEKTDSAFGLFADYQIRFAEHLSFQLGIRRDDFNRSGIEDTGTVHFEMRRGMGTFYSKVSKAFKAPSLYQSFDPTYGNIDLEAESSQSFELGYQLKMGIAYIEVAIFQNEFVNLIDFDFTNNRYTNIAGLTTTRGADLSFGHIWAQHRVGFSGSYLDMTKNQEPLLRRPQNTYRGEYNYGYGKLSFGTAFLWIGRRADFNVNLPAQQSLDVFATWKADHYRLYTRIENIQDKELRQVAGYSPSRRHGSIGVELSF